MRGGDSPALKHFQLRVGSPGCESESPAVLHLRHYGMGQFHGELVAFQRNDLRGGYVRCGSVGKQTHHYLPSSTGMIWVGYRHAKKKPRAAREGRNAPSGDVLILLPQRGGWQKIPL